MKQRTFIDILLGICAILFLTNSSCGSDTDDGPTISVQPTTITLEADGTGQTISVSSNTSWTAVPRDSWLKCSPAGGTGGNSITVSADINTGEERSTKLTLTDKTNRATAEVRVIQKKEDSSSPTPAPDPTLTVKPTSLNFSSSAASNTFTIESNTSWTVKSDQAWCTVNSLSGSNNATITVSVTENTSIVVRNATITISYGNKSTTFLVSQEASSQEDTYAIQAIAGGASITNNTGHSLLLKNDGTLWAWGANHLCQLGDGTNTDRHLPIKVLDNVKQVDAGLLHTIAILNDGTLWTWGSNSNGQIGNGTSGNRQELPIKVMDNVKQAVAGYEHTLAVKKDGTLWAWGRNVFGELGNGTKTDRDAANPDPIYIMDDVEQVATGFTHSLAIKKDGTLWAWGNNTEGQLGDGTLEEKLRPIKIMDNVKSVIAGDRNSFMLKSDNSLWAWGYNSSGNFGNGTHEYSNPTPVNIAEKVVQIAPGSGHTLILKEDATLWGCGHKSDLGVGSEEGYEYNFVKLMSNVELVATSHFGNHSLVVKSDGTLWGWGPNKYGQLGNGTTADFVTLPIQSFTVSSLK